MPSILTYEQQSGVNRGKHRMSLDDHEDPEEQLQQDSNGAEVSSLENLQIDLLTIHDGSISGQCATNNINNVEQQTEKFCCCSRSNNQAIYSQLKAVNIRYKIITFTACLYEI